MLKNIVNVSQYFGKLVCYVHAEVNNNTRAKNKLSNKFKWMPILRTGTFTDKNNQTVSIDEAALDKIVASTDLTKEPQLVVEHPQFDKIGFGTIEQLKRVGDYLFALPKLVEKKFKEAVNGGDLPGRSVTLDKNNFSLRNISFLPPTISPAVSGLGEYSFQEMENGKLKMEYAIPGIQSHFADLETTNFEFAQYEISKYPFKTIQDILRNIKNYFIQLTKSAEEADKIIPEWLLNEVGFPPAIWEKESLTNALKNSFISNMNFQSNNNGDNMSIKTFDLSKIDPNLRTAIEGLNDQISTLQTDLASKDTELQSATTKLSAAERATLNNEVLQFCASDDVKLKVMPAIKDKVVNFLMGQKEKSVIEFSTSDNTKVQLNCFDFAKELVKMLPDVVSPIELATNLNAGEKTADYLKTAKAIADSVNR